MRGVQQDALDVVFAVQAFDGVRQFVHQRDREHVIGRMVQRDPGDVVADIKFDVLEDLDCGTWPGSTSFTFWAGIRRSRHQAWRQGKVCPESAARTRPVGHCLFGQWNRKPKVTITLMKIALGADHAGFELKDRIKQHLSEQGIAVQDLRHEHRRFRRLSGFCPQGRRDGRGDKPASWAFWCVAPASAWRCRPIRFRASVPPIAIPFSKHR